MNKKLIVGIASLLKIDKDVITEALGNEDGDSGLIKTFREQNNIFTLDEVATLKKNSKAEGVSELEKATEFPSAIYNRVKGLALEKAEKESAKKYGIEKWSGLDDLMSQISTQGKGGDGEKDEQIKLLKDSLLKKDTEWELKVKEVEDKHTTDFLNRDFSAVASKLESELDGEEETIKNQNKLYSAAFHSNFDKAYKDGKTIVLDKNGKTIVDDLGEPSSLFDVYRGFAVTHGAKIKEVDPGGRGDGSSEDKQKSNLKGKSFNEVRVEAKVAANTDASDALFSEWSAANK